MALVLAAGFGGGYWYARRAPSGAAQKGGRKILYWVDPMHPAYKSDRPGIAPDCGMKYIPRDLAFAKAAASEVLRRGEKDASQEWENPTTGARGTVTPIASAYTQDGQTCRDFLASYVTKSAQSWLQGEACQEDRGAWQVRALKPWKSS